jgi:hypothetical protein
MDLRAAHQLAVRQDDAISVRQLMQLGLTESAIRHRVAAHGWQRVVRGGLLVPPVRSLDRARARAVTLVLPQAVISHGTAARLHRLEGLPLDGTTEPTHATLPPSAPRRQRAGVRLHWARLQPGDHEYRRGMPVTSAPRTVLDALRALDRGTAVCLVESALRQALLTPADIEVLRARLVGRPGGAERATWLDLVSPLARSPLETLVRLPLVDAGIGPEKLQYDVYDDLTGRWLARPDMAWPSLRLAGECDGFRYHRGWEAFRWDRRRQNALLCAGWLLVRFTYDDALHPHYLVQEVLRAQARARLRQLSA